MQTIQSLHPGQEENRQKGCDNDVQSLAMGVCHTSHTFYSQDKGTLGKPLANRCLNTLNCVCVNKCTKYVKLCMRYDKWSNRCHSAVIRHGYSWKLQL